MAAASTITTSTNYNEENSHNYRNEASRQEIQAAIAKAGVEIRALHTALLQGGGGGSNSSPSSNNNKLLSSPMSRLHQPQLSAQDYPVFTPSYEDQPLPGYQQLQLASQPLSSDAWEDYGSEVNQSNYAREIVNVSSRKGLLPPSLLNLVETHTAYQTPDDTRSVTSSCANNNIRTSPAAAAAADRVLKSRRRNSMGDCSKHSNNIVVPMPLTDTHASMQSSQAQPKTRGPILSWLFPRLGKNKKKKNHTACSPLRTESEDAPQIDYSGMLNVETLRKEVMEANQKRDAALSQVAEMRSSFRELKGKLENLESYCEGLKRALKQAVQLKDLQKPPGNVSKRGSGKSVNGDRAADNLMPVSEEVMVEGFLQIVSESRLSVKNFCKTLVAQIEETDDQLVDNLNTLLQPHKLSLNSRYSKAVLYHLESIINQVLYQDFENCVFQKDGSPKILDPQQDRQAQFSSFVALRNLSWNEVLRKGTKYYSEEFSKFCDQKMSCIISTLSMTRPWSEQLLQSFFVAAKCIWLLHLLAFSFSPPLMILRVDENRPFDAHYMEDIFMDRQRTQGPSRVKIMVMPGFYVQDRILRCKVLCRYKNVG